MDTIERRRQVQQLTREQLTSLQLEKLNSLLHAVLPHNEFYASKLHGIELPITDLEAFTQLPFTIKDQLLDGGHGTAANRTYDIQQYVRFHRTSGTHGRPLVVLDTAEDWNWWINTWQFVLDAAELDSGDRVFAAFSFGPFIGFWSAFDAVLSRGAMAVPGGGLSTLARIDVIRSNQISALFCTPTYALHLAEIARQHEIDVRALGVKRVIVAGEPGGSLPAVRARIEEQWGARVIDHSGATEIGPWGFADTDQLGIHVIESEFLAEFFSVETGQPAADGELAELVLTTLGRHGCPVIRYRTGDLVRARHDSSHGSEFVLLEGGVLGRADDMLIIRGVNIFPSSLEQILRGFPEVVEYRITATKAGNMDALSIEVEDRLEDVGRIAQELQTQLGLRVQVQSVPSGSLPRFEAKGRRFIDQRNS